MPTNCILSVSPQAGSEVGQIDESAEDSRTEAAEKMGDPLDVSGLVAPEEDIREHVVVLTGVQVKKVTTVLKLISLMIEEARPIYEELYSMRESERTKIVFKFEASSNLDVNETTGDDGLKRDEQELQGEIQILCKHQHPYLDYQVWLETRDMETTILNGNHL